MPSNALQPTPWTASGRGSTHASLHRPVGIFLLLWPTLWALWIAGLVGRMPWWSWRDGEACLRAFRRSHWLGAAVFAGIWADLGR